MKKPILCKLCLVVFGALLAVQSVSAGNWNQGSEKNGRISQAGSPSLEAMRQSFQTYFQGGLSRGVTYRYPSGASQKPYEFERNVYEDETVTRALANTGLISYLLFRKNQIVVDQISPKDRLGDLIDESSTRFNSQSVGKSMVSYALGHAICEGYISSLDQDVSDWPLARGTLYENQSLIDLVNMSASDGKYFRAHRAFIKNAPSGLNDMPISSWSVALQGTKPAAKLFGSAFSYNGFLSNFVNNYILFKTGKNYRDFLHRLFVEKVRVRSNVFWVQAYTADSEGPLRSTFFATRDDYLRIAVSMLDDWNNNTCVGQYLKDLYDRRVKNAYNPKGGHGLFRSKTHSKGTYYDYAGFFHTNPAGGKGTMFIMHGYGGQVIAINFDTGTIVVANSVHEDWDTGRLIIDAVNQ